MSENREHSRKSKEGDSVGPESPSLFGLDSSDDGVAIQQPERYAVMNMSRSAMSTLASSFRSALMLLALYAE